MRQNNENFAVTPANVCAMAELAALAVRGDFSEIPIRCGKCGLLVASDEGLGRGPRVVKISTRTENSDAKACQSTHNSLLVRDTRVQFPSESVRFFTSLKW